MILRVSLNSLELEAHARATVVFTVNKSEVSPLATNCSPLQCSPVCSAITFTSTAV
jgi:hypothetical protein